MYQHKLSTILMIAFCTFFITQQSLARPLELTTDDEVRIHASMSGRGNHGVLLVHGRERSSVAWKLFAEKLAAKNIRVLMIDLRGHGDSEATPLSGDETYAAMLLDVKAGLAALRRYELKHVSIIGADLGANLAVQVAADTAAVTNLVLLSPGFKIKGLKVTGPLATYGERPVFLAAATDDEYSKKTVTYLKSKALGKSKLLLSSGATTGTKLLEEHPELEDSIIQWLSGKFGDDTLESGKPTISIEAADKMESQGKSFGE